MNELEQSNVELKHNKTFEEGRAAADTSELKLQIRRLEAELQQENTYQPQPPNS